PEWRTQWRDLLVSLSIRPLFLQDRAPSGIVRLQPTALFLFGTLRTLWPRVWSSLSDVESSTVLALPEDIRQPDRPHRLVRDILIWPPRVNLAQWEETYLE